MGTRKGAKSKKPRPSGRGLSRLSKKDFEIVTPIGDEERVEADAADMHVESMPGFTVTIRGTLPKAFASIVVRKGPIRATTKEAAIAKFMSELGATFKKPDLFEPAQCDVEEVKVARQGRLALGEGAKKGEDEAPAAAA